MSINHAYSHALLEDSPYYQELFRQHEELESELQGLKRSPAPATEELQRLKKLKLSVVDKMHAMELGTGQMET